MIKYFFSIAIGSIILGIVSEYIKDCFVYKVKVSETDRYFFNSPSDNAKIDKIIRSRCFFLSLSTNVALVLLVLLLYWLCL